MQQQSELPGIAPACADFGDWLAQLEAVAHGEGFVAGPIAPQDRPYWRRQWEKGLSPAQAWNGSE